MNLKLLIYAARTILVLCIPFFLLTAVIAVAFNSLSLYEYGFRKYDVSEDTGLASIELTEAVRSLIDYFNSGEELPGIRVEKDGVEFDLFTEEESIHMKDVKGLLRFDYGVLLGTGLYILAYAVTWLWLKKPRRQLVRGFLFGSVLTIVIMLALYLGSLWDFDWLFYRFHLLAFTNDFWSAEGYMLKLFPGGFWYDTVLFCALGITAGAGIIGLPSGLWLYFTGKGLHFQRLMS